MPALRLRSSPPFVASVTIVGLEACPPEIMGHRRPSSTEEVRSEFERVAASRYPVSFVTMDEWAATADPRSVDFPPHMREGGVEPESQPDEYLELMEEVADRCNLYK